RARVLIDLVVVLEERFRRGEPVALALGLRADRLTLLDRVEPALERGGVEGTDERVRPLADRDAPVRDRAARVGLRNGREGLDRLREEERMEHRQRALELLLSFR